jgi:hypothetical protein
MLKWNTYVLLVFAMLLTGLKVSGQSNPVPFNLGGGNYLFNTWSSSSLAGTYPANMFLHTCSADSNPSLGDPTTGDYTGVYNSGTGNRFTGLAASGLSMFNKTKTPSTVGAVVIGLNTTGRTNILVSFESRSWASGNAYNLRLQYRISTVSPWLDVPGPIEYIYTGVIPNTQTLSVNLSTATANAVDNRSNMQLRWKYYYVSGFLASSNNIGLDEINISSSLLAQIPTNGLVGYWPFNGNANDISGNANNGIVTGATLTNDRFGNPSSAYTFNGTSNFITSTFAPFTTPPFTISAWVKIDSLLSLSPIVSIGEMALHH